MTEVLLKDMRPLPDALERYGFRKTAEGYSYATEMLDGQFRCTVILTDGGRMFTEVVDVCTEEPYTLHLAEDFTGPFVGSVRSAYSGILSDISEKCFEKSVFREAAARELIAYVRGRYGDELEYLWEKSPKNAVWRRKDNQKWYAALLAVRASRLGLAGEEEVCIVDLRMKPEEIPGAVDGVTVFRGYHMNKSHWITVLLDGSMPSERLNALLDESYRLANKR